MSLEKPPQQRGSVGIDLGTSVTKAVVIIDKTPPLFFEIGKKQSCPTSVVYGDKPGFANESYPNANCVVRSFMLLVGSQNPGPAFHGMFGSPICSTLGEGDARLLINSSPEEGTKEVSARQVLKDYLVMVRDSLNSEFPDRSWKLGLTVPGCYMSDSRLYLLNVAKEVGFKDLIILDSHLCISYYFNGTIFLPNKRTVLILDIGGGCCDMGVVDMSRDDNLRVLSCYSSSECCGDIIDKLIANTVRSDYAAKHSGQSFMCLVEEDEQEMSKRDNVKLMTKLLKICKAAKESLSTQDCEYLNLENLGKKIDFDYEFELTNTLLASILSSALDKMDALIDRTIKSSQRDSIDAVLLMGDSSRCRPIQDYVYRKFAKSNVVKCSTHAHAAAYGAGFIANSYDNWVKPIQCIFQRQILVCCVVKGICCQKLCFSPSKVTSAVKADPIQFMWRSEVLKDKDNNRNNNNNNNNKSSASKYSSEPLITLVASPRGSEKGYSIDIRVDPKYLPQFSKDKNYGFRLQLELRQGGKMKVVVVDDKDRKAVEEEMDVEMLWTDGLS